MSLLCYDTGMTPKLKTMLARAETWPETEQDEFAAIVEAFASEIEERRTGLYHLTGEELDAVEEALAQADRGEFVPDEIIAEADRRRGL
jgi:predicted transcriptional regulator